MKFDVTYKGKVMELAQGEVYTLRPDGRFAYASAVYDFVTRVTLTGYTETSTSGNEGYQTTSGGYIFLSDGWKQVGVQAVMQYSQSQAQALVNKIVENNKQVLRCNLLCARYSNLLTENQRTLVRDLQNRLQERNNALQSGGLTTKIEKGYPEEYSELSPYLEKLMKGEEVGVASWIVIVVACVIVAGLGTAAYFAYKSLADESERDVKYSKELTRTLTSKLTEEEYQQLLSETKGMLTKSKIKSLVSGYSGAIKMVAVFAGAYAVYKLIKDRRS